MFCTECGTKLDDGAVFCTNCGHKLATEATVATAAPVAEPIATPVAEPAVTPVAEPVQPASQSMYSEPASQSMYSQPTSQSMYSEPASQSMYSQPTGQSMYSQPNSSMAGAAGAAYGASQGHMEIIHTVHRIWMRLTTIVRHSRLRRKKAKVV